MLTDKKFRELQLVQASIMDDIHRVCLKNNLKYYMIGGTALGAIRHKGFIPWDVDIDIAMPREDYEKFIQIANNELDSRHECHSYLTDKDFTSPHILVVLKNSYIVFPRDITNNSASRPGIYIDILPLDQVPTDKREREKHAKALQRIKKLKIHKASTVWANNSRWQIIAKWFIRTAFKVVSWRKLNHIQQKIAMRYNNLPDTGEICSTLSHYKYEKLCMPKSVFGNPKLYEFEGRQYYGPEDMEAYLTKIFGNYMQLPPLETQEKLRNCVVDANW